MNTRGVRYRKSEALATRTLVILGTVSLVLLAGCGSKNSSSPVNNSQSIPNATITGPYDLILTAMNGHDLMNICASFTQTGASFTGAGNTLACPSNDPSQC